MYRYILSFLICSFAYGSSPIVTSNIKINYSNLDDLKDDIETIVSQDSASAIFDQIENTKVEISLLNDYNFKDPNDPDLEKLNDDIGRTHGIKMSVHKNIAPLMDGSDLYYVSISYETNLYTNIPEDVPRPINFYDLAYVNDRGFLQVDVYFKEENLLRMMIGKMKSGNAMYWEAGVGYQEINSEDNDRAFLLSSVAQQRWLHEGVNNLNGATLREYNYLTQDGNQQSLTLEGELGYDQTLFQRGEHRSFSRVGTRARVSQIDGASFVGAYIRLGHDYNPSGPIPAIRVAGGYELQRYSSGDNYEEASFEVAMRAKSTVFKFRYIMPFSHDPSYLNVMPSELSTQLPNIEPMVELSVQGHFK